MVYILGNERLLRVVLDMFVSGKKQGKVEPYEAADVAVVFRLYLHAIDSLPFVLVELTTKKY